MSMAKLYHTQRVLLEILRTILWLCVVKQNGSKHGSAPFWGCDFAKVHVNGNQFWHVFCFASVGTARVFTTKHPKPKLHLSPRLVRSHYHALVCVWVYSQLLYFCFKNFHHFFPPSVLRTIGYHYQMPFLMYYF